LKGAFLVVEFVEYSDIEFVEDSDIESVEDSDIEYVKDSNIKSVEDCDKASVEYSDIESDAIQIFGMIMPQTLQRSSLRAEDEM